MRTYLGRPWRAHARTVFIRTVMSDAVQPEGWHNWDRPERELTSRYFEYANTGPGAATAGRVGWVHALSPADADAENAADLLAGPDNWEIPGPVSY